MRRALVFLAFAATLAAADISGTWSATVQSDMGSGTPVFVLKQGGEKLTGTYTGALGEAPVTGAVKGQAVTIEIEVQGAKVVYTGKLDAEGRKMEGKVDFAGMGSGTFTAARK
ncbi:MAG TPA: hypothetical protein VLH09_02280 [Bryobacteraceae bacterium]|nr:hypothetical protein [Bryobacteraceae bacterium]